MILDGHAAHIAAGTPAPRCRTCAEIRADSGGEQHDYGYPCECEECLPPCVYCGSTETVELSRDDQTITICAQCGAD